MDRQGNTYTFLYASVMVIVVAAILAFLAQSLKPMQDKNAAVAKKMDILKSVQIESTAANAEEKYNKYIGENAYVLDINGEKKPGLEAFTVDLAKEVKKGDDERAYPIYECKLDNGQTKYIIPVRGKGLWGPIWGYVSLDDDKNTVFGATFGHKGETPGLGAEITTDMFQKPFTGKKLFDENGQFASIEVVKKGQSQGDLHKVDGISGGTITSVGVGTMLEDCLSGYEKFLKN
ncbi:NADH:ubiquinone reductase (Na(+)-transporting) subunit C [Carboxylicivirga sediminis]|uniref:Na(+)-translocating NADH-quinone reductase subunit C n=1 Tax=Carboxylicivirga sediminis TaxID=2006564 RepID=A0A941F377_9BACT|nr:NADH:ubiquinone reductase (Na(+)-transporting) subunit C [Carboxylicivirga sediminis]MBR8535938.1 NADH:ubiquinone reductase (Na(+)-transporting) subunit C [Carboxylicivirga sediminis]